MAVPIGHARRIWKCAKVVCQSALFCAKRCAKFGYKSDKKGLKREIDLHILSKVGKN